MTRSLTITLVMPACNAWNPLVQVLTPGLAVRYAGESEEVLLVDDCWPDRTAEAMWAIGVIESAINSKSN